MPSFVVNPLSLCIPQSSFEAWLKDKGFLEILEKCTLDNAIIAGQGSFVALCKLLKLNPFESLTVEDLGKKPVPWTAEFLDCGKGPAETYSWPMSVTQVKFRMDENLKRYTGNYLVLIAITFACVLYKMPLALLGVVSLFGLWDGLRILINKFKIQRHGVLFRLLVALGNVGTMLLLMYCRVALALICAAALSFTVLVLHSSMRKITPPNT
ncbi:hypothetical protein SELMODRAFT_186360 [Selaginella moellendorffii]|uniref:PRA1 family protein n=1 Tax=Selaginella moellendorffii TaxID=88036 RepID=D8T884_SELML|nr:PRA1 family protein H isoform X2 [Selaginella moellendorffii]EFJ07168.1 hypothetical protein SELMODRAFT_186360 [Selaginella moellendorffii]|eukprot:XP_002991764.1 PRA1 family protein H isoform X2 [Selaginella moellendorffii]